MRLGIIVSLAAMPACVYRHVETTTTTREAVELVHATPDHAPEGQAQRVRLHHPRAPSIDLHDVVVAHDGADLTLTPRAGRGSVVRVPLDTLEAVDVERVQVEQSLQRASATHAEPLIIGLVATIVLTGLAFGVAIGKSVDDWTWSDSEDGL